MVRIFIYPVLSALLLYSCNGLTSPNEQKNAVTIKWFEGNFEYVTEHGLYREFWKKHKANEYIGKGYFLHRGDTSFLMRMKLFIESDVIKMDYDVKGQNEGKNILFALTKQDKGLYVFENPFHDFPSIRQYKLLGDTAVSVREQGFEDNKNKVIDFIMSKIKSEY